MYMQNDKISVWLDCDPGNDDAMTILYSLFDPKCDLRGISTVFSNIKVSKVTDNALRILSSLGRKDVPVVIGSSSSLNDIPLEELPHGGDGMFKAHQLPLDMEPIQGVDLFDIIKQQLGDEQFVFVMTGAQTNAAKLFQEHPDILDQIEKVVFMGGVSGFGNVTPNAEFNVFADPDACHEVIQICEKYEVPLVMIPLDLTRSVQVTEEIIEQLQKEDNNEFITWCVDLLYEYADIFEQDGLDFPILSDPLALHYALYPKDFNSQEINVQIDRSNGKCWGRTVCDLYNLTNLDPNITYCSKVDVDNFWNKMIFAIGEASRIAQMVNF